MRILISLLLILSWQILFALEGNLTIPQLKDSNGRITGIVLDSLTREPVEYATIALVMKGSEEIVTGAITDQRGIFSLLEIPYANYDLIISFVGYNTRRIEDIKISAADMELNLGQIIFSPAATNLTEVSIQALRPTITMEADRMVVNVEGTVMAEGNNAFEVLSRSPGVFVDHEGNIQLNGKPGVLVMINDKPTYLSANELKTLLEGMSAENIRNIEIITNPPARYDAEGTAGIININMKRNVPLGINGSVYANYSYNSLHGYASGGNFNYGRERWNFFLNTDFTRTRGGREATFTRVFFRPADTTYFDQTATAEWESRGPSVRTGATYHLNERHRVGFMAHLTLRRGANHFFTETFLGSAPNQPGLFIDAKNSDYRRHSNSTNNIHYIGQLDTHGTTLTADVDFIRIRTHNQSDFINYFTDLDQQTVSQDFLFTDVPSGFDIYSANLDLTRPFGSGKRLEIGAKASRVFSDNDSRFYFNNDELIPDPLRTNHFQYTENIYAAYGSFRMNVTDRLSSQVGLRAEQTRSLGESLTTGEVNETSYLDWFPSLFLQQKVSDNYQVNFNYSHRLRRPHYGSLNPFIFYRDPYTYTQGNPGLRPQYTHAFSLSQVIRSMYLIGLEYQRTHDVIRELPILDVENAITIYTEGNVSHSQYFAMRATVPVRPLPKWESNNTVVMAYQNFGMEVNGEELLNEQLFYMIHSSHTIILPAEFRFEVNIGYRGPAADGLYRVAPMSWLDLGIRRTFFENLDVSLNATDLWRGRRLIFTTDIGENINDFDQYFLHRSIRLTARYNFSRGQQVDIRRRNTIEELERTGS